MILKYEIEVRVTFCINTVKVVLEPPPLVGSAQFFLRGGGYIWTSISHQNIGKFTNF